MGRTLRVPAAALTITLAGILAGCATGPVGWYGGALHPRAEDAVLSPVGGDLQRHFTVVIVELDGRALDAAAVDEVRLRPGPHAFRARVKFGTYLAGSRLHWQEAEVHLAFDAQQGHTYLPDASLASGVAFGSVTDLGEDYPGDCLPAARRGFPGLAATREANTACQLVRQPVAIGTGGTPGSAISPR
jgi:hypothetical protein